MLCHKSLYDVGPNDVIPGRCYSSNFLLTMLFHDDVIHVTRENSSYELDDSTKLAVFN
jgi:hypothetical protein